MVLLTVNHTAREIAHLSQLTRPKGWIVPSKYRKTDFLPIIQQVKRENSNLEKVILVGGDASSEDLKLEDLLKSNAGTAEIRAGVGTGPPGPG